MEFIKININYIIVVIFTILSTSVYTIKTIYISKEKTTQVLITNALYVLLNTMVTRSLVKGNTLIILLVSVLSSELGYFLGFKIKTKIDPSMQKEDKLWVFNIKCDTNLAEKFMKSIGNNYNIKHIIINENEQEFICSNKTKSKQIRNFIEVYDLEHTIEEKFSFKRNKLSNDEKKEIKNKIENN